MRALGSGKNRIPEHAARGLAAAADAIDRFGFNIMILLHFLCSFESHWRCNNSVATVL
jgi:hypothetical protein